MQPHRGTTVLVLGILSLVVCPILGPFAWKMGNTDLAKISAGQMDPAGRDTTNAGKICGLIGTILLILGVIFWVIYGIFFLLVGGAALVGGGLESM
ncbi:MAG: DUF4190 domain-containing protein [Verrucomicrobiota bacterium]